MWQVLWAIEGTGGAPSPQGTQSWVDVPVWQGTVLGTRVLYVYQEHKGQMWGPLGEGSLGGSTE